MLYKYAFIRLFLGQGRGKELGDLLLKCSCWGGRRREGEVSSCAVVCCRQPDKAARQGSERQECNCFHWDSEVVRSHENCHEGLRFLLVHLPLLYAVCYFYKPCSSSRGVTKPDVFWIPEADQKYFLPDHVVYPHEACCLFTLCWVM